MWAVGDTWERVFTALTAQAGAEEELNRAVSVDSTIVRARLRGSDGPPARPTAPWAARTGPDVVLADKAYSSRAIRDHLGKRGIRAVIPVPANQADHRLRRGSRGGRPPAFDRDAYKQRNPVERCINRLKQ
ncbi:transposase [Streptomyces hirsutus]|uniref:transposase n=1 Tax=Streptomyces hirsutus TaxID=35620 RepID=UPI003697B956